MIQVTVHDKKNKLLREFFYEDSEVTLESAIALVEKYVKDEQFNLRGDCYLKAHYSSKKQAA